MLDIFPLLFILFKYVFGRLLLVTLCSRHSVCPITLIMSHFESVNVDVDSVGHNSEPTTVETREIISNVEMSVSNLEEITSIEVNSPVPLDHEDSLLDEVRSELPEN